jgi:molecular chaperone DnaK (HSP70)
MRMVRDAIAQAIGLTPSTVPEPIHGAALGGAIMGRVELARQGLPMIVGGLRLPPPDLFIREITPYPLGITVLSPDGKELANDVIISKNSPVPCEMTRRYAPALAGQSEVRVELLQGDPQTSRERCLVLGHLDMCDLPKIVDRPHPIEVRVRIDRNGKATVTAQDTISGKCGEMTVDYKRGLPPVEAAA